ncbi:hypothetical protein [Glycomyces arizonensis]|uniref:hypothetical protein n=1 Tax=Glycomyces arizonensis TaxID=256035 RepID=UPI00040233EF|nr:hypothetical protein [Glycomyces arizonensis]
MRRRGSDQVGRWPWGVWLALVGVSAGTVASFAAVGWAFLYATGPSEGSGDAEPLAWDQDRVVIEPEETPGDTSAPGGAEPTAEALSAPEPEAATVPVESAPDEPEPEHVAEAAEVDPRLVPVEPEPPVEEAGEERMLVPIEPSLELVPDDEGEPAGECSDRVSLLGELNAR